MCAHPPLKLWQSPPAQTYCSSRHSSRSTQRRPCSRQPAPHEHSYLHTHIHYYLQLRPSRQCVCACVCRSPAVGVGAGGRAVVAAGRGQLAALVHVAAVAGVGGQRVPGRALAPERALGVAAAAVAAHHAALATLVDVCTPHRPHDSCLTSPRGLTVALCGSRNFTRRVSVLLQIEKVTGVLNTPYAFINTKRKILLLLS